MNFGQQTLQVSEHVTYLPSTYYMIEAEAKNMPLIATLLISVANVPMMVLSSTSVANASIDHIEYGSR